MPRQSALLRVLVCVLLLSGYSAICIGADKENGVGGAVIGKDGAPMVLVPAGEFLMQMAVKGVMKEQPMSLPAFYMDKFEVTTKRYAAFIQATRRTAPLSWSEVNLERDGDRPVVGVTWRDADAYCRYYGRRLPSPPEWIKAGRGTDGRKYPWGNEEPNRSLANYWAWEPRVFPSWSQYEPLRSLVNFWFANLKTPPPQWEGYTTLATVESYEAGKSPYGIYNMAGNVSEWTLGTDYNGKTEAFSMGGSWGAMGSDMQLDRAFARWSGQSERTRSLDGGFRCAQDAR